MNGLEQSLLFKPLSTKSAKQLGLDAAVQVNKQRIALNNNVSKDLLENRIVQNEKDVKTLDKIDKDNAQKAEAESKKLEQQLVSKPLTKDERNELTQKLMDAENRRRLGLISPQSAG
jgi:hypothetical protein